MPSDCSRIFDRKHKNTSAIKLVDLFRIPYYEVDIKPLHGNWKWKKYSIINSQLHRINNWLEWDSFLLPSMQDDKISISLVTNEYNKHFLSHCSFFTKGNDKKLTEERETLTRGHTSAMWCLFNYSNIASSICRTKSSANTLFMCQNETENEGFPPF